MINDTVTFIKGFDLHTIIIVGVAFWYLNSSLGGRLDEIEKDMNTIKTVLICKKIMPSTLAKDTKQGE